MLAIRRLAFNHHMNEFLEQAYLGAKNAVYPILKWNTMYVLIGLLKGSTSRGLDSRSLEIPSHPRFLCHQHSTNITQMPKYGCTGQQKARSLCLLGRAQEIL